MGTPPLFNEKHPFLSQYHHIPNDNIVTILLMQFTFTFHFHLQNTPLINFGFNLVTQNQLSVPVYFVPNGVTIDLVAKHKNANMGVAVFL